MAFFVLCISLLVCGVGFRAAIHYLNITLQKEEVPLRDHFATIPRTLGPWRAVGEDGIIPAETVESLGTNQYLNRNYVRELDGDRLALNVHLAYYTGMIDTMPHVPDRCLQAAGLEQRSKDPDNIPLPIDVTQWPGDPALLHMQLNVPYPTTMFAHHVTGKPVRVHMPIGDFALRTMEFSDPNQPELRIFAGYFFIANGRTTPVPWQVKALAFDPREKYAYYCKVQFMYWGDQDADQDTFLAATADLTQYMLPRLMQCLPDWAEVERRTIDASDVVSAGSEIPAARGGASPS